jgi:hypothetical protein
MIHPADLPHAAVMALEHGLDSPALRRLAGQGPQTDDQLSPLFQRAVTELALLVDDRPTAAKYLASRLSQQIAEGSLEPLEGARQIAEVARAVNSASFHDLDAFIYVDSEAPERPEDRDLFVSVVMTEARSWAQRVQP